MTMHSPLWPKHQYELVNPYAFEAPIAPHIAADQSGVEIEIGHIKACYEQITAQVDVVVIEGAGGWLVPISASQTGADMVRECGWDVVLVVGMRLGCLNHALLSVASIAASQCTLKAWVANSASTEMLHHASNIEALKSRINEPLIATIPWINTADQEAQDNNNYFSNLPF